MDKFIMTQTDMENLFEWKNKHMNLVRQNNVPIKAIEVILKENKLQLKYVRNEDKITVYCTVDNKQRFKYELQVLFNSKYQVIKSPKDVFFGEMGFITDIATLYFALMALMVYGNEDKYSAEELAYIHQHKAELMEKSQSQHKHNKGKNIVYLLQRDKNGKLVYRPQGSHNSPKGIFSVRGHLRHLKTGKVVWVKEYKKGTGKHKNKTYKM